MTTPVHRRQPVLVMETGVAQVAGGAAAGWVSGNPASLAASASVTCVFDLGPDWDQYVVLNVVFSPVIPSSGASGLQLYGSDTTTQNGARKLASPASGNFATGWYTASAPSSSGSTTAVVRPQGRYVHALMTNADVSNAMGPSTKISLFAYPA